MRERHDSRCEGRQAHGRGPLGQPPDALCAVAVDAEIAVGAVRRPGAPPRAVVEAAAMSMSIATEAVAISGAFRTSCRDPESKAVIQVLWFRWICLRDGFSEADSNFR